MQGRVNELICLITSHTNLQVHLSLPNSKTSEGMLLRFAIDLFTIVLSLIQQLLGIQENVWVNIKAGLINHNGLELDCHGPHASNAWALTKRSWWCYSCIVMHHAEDAQGQAAGRGCLHSRHGLVGLSCPKPPKENIADRWRRWWSGHLYFDYVDGSDPKTLYWSGSLPR